MDKNETVYKAVKDPMPEETKPAENPAETTCLMLTGNNKQTALTVLADQKANALIGVLTVIFSILFANIQHLSRLPLAGRIAFFGFVLMEVFGMIFALLVIFPKNITVKGYEKPEQMPNPLFFGMYTLFPEQDYVTYLMDRLASGAARQLMATDYYQVGIILKQKYKQLRSAYLMSAVGFGLFLLALLSGVLRTIVSGE